ncbi:BofC C-terminal domain-containing protein [Paenibacillus sediminis]|nr:BofC C-terminal domain-containing protein [Paenibacillus sediminis]
MFRLKKQLKKRFKRWRRSLWTFAACGMIALLAWMGLPLSDKIQSLMTSTEPIALEVLSNPDTSEVSSQTMPNHLTQLLKSSKQSRTVHLKTIYVCGEETVTLGKFKADEILKMSRDHSDWSGKLDEQGEVWFVHQINDLSDNCKKQAYFSIDKNGNLTLFEGPPQKEKVMRTFFQLDVGSMETSLPEGVLDQLEQGIRIQDIDEYNSVLSTFSDYAVEVSEKVMKPGY